MTLFCHGAARFFEGLGLACSTSKKREPSPTDVGIGVVNKKNRVVPLVQTVRQLMRDLKGEDVADDIGSRSCVGPSSPSKNG